MMKAALDQHPFPIRQHSMPWATLIALAFLTTSLLMPTAYAQEAQLDISDAELGADWRFEAHPPAEGVMTVGEVEGRDGEVLSLKRGGKLQLRTTKPMKGSYVVEAVVRLGELESRRPSGEVTLRVGLPETDGVPAYSLQALRNSRADRGFIVRPIIGAGSVQDRLNGQRTFENPWGASISFAPRYGADDISPLMEAALRQSLEEVVDYYPHAGETWRRVRIEVRPRDVRLYHDDTLVADNQHPGGVSGHVGFELEGQADLASLTIKRLERADAGYVTAPLGDLYNASGFADASKVVGQQEIEGIPFAISPAGEHGDHVDIGESLFRYRNATGWSQAAHPNRVIPYPRSMDPARLQLRVPARVYSRAWVLAAFDGEPHNLPEMTLRFYQPQAGWWVDQEVTVPGLNAKSADGAKPIKVKDGKGKNANLWLLPIKIDAARLASEYREEAIFFVELTKKIKPFRAYPDPAQYGYHQGGLPSGVRLYGLTFEEAPVEAFGVGMYDGNTYTHPALLKWRVPVRNQTDREQKVTVTLDVTTPFGTNEKLTKHATVAGDASMELNFVVPQHEFGLYTIDTQVSVGNWTQTREGTLLSLPPNTRQANRKSSRWGLWAWEGSHDTNDDIESVLRLRNAIGALHSSKSANWVERRKWDIAIPSQRVTGFRDPKWLFADDFSPENYAEEIAEWRESIKKIMHVAASDDRYFARGYGSFGTLAEDSVSLRVNHGAPPYAFGEGDWYEYTDREKAKIRGFLWYCQEIACIGKELYPGAKGTVFGHCSPLFFPPFFREGIDQSLFIGFGTDSPQFERMPERQPRATEPSLMYFLKKEMKEHGYEDFPIIHEESFFPQAHPLAMGPERQAQSVVRTAALAMSWGTDAFHSCWALFVSADYWGTQHYGATGLYDKRPEYNPQVAAAAYATMTLVLDLADYQGWLDVGSRSSYLLHFADRDRDVYSAWTFHGNRPLEVTVEGNEPTIEMVDQWGNRTPLDLDDQGKTSVEITPTPIWLVVRDGKITEGQVGEPTYDAKPGEHKVVIEDFDDKSWAFNKEPNANYDQNHWDVRREPGDMSHELVADEARSGKVMQVTLNNPDQNKPLVGFYGTYEPAKPITIDGKARAIGWYGKGSSNWSRVVFEFEDANGEIWQSTGDTDAWNCDDIHSWSYFAHDGWKYMEFPLPQSEPGDNYRHADNVWWDYDEEGVVDLPLKLNRMFVQIRPQMVYCDVMEPVADPSVAIDDLMAVYDSAEMQSKAPVEVQQATRDMYRPKKLDPARLPNPIAQLQETGNQAAPQLVGMSPPPERVAGDKVIVELKPVEGAKSYHVWVSAYPQGYGAKEVRARPQDDQAHVLEVSGLQPAIPMYLFFGYKDEEGKMSKPSPARETILRDEFPMK